MTYDNLSAMNAFADGMAVSAHNIANISTPNYTSVQYNYGAGPANNVELQVDPNPAQIVSPNQSAPPPITQSPLIYETYGMANNTVDLAREFTVQIATEHAFEANAIAISTREEMEQSLYNQIYGPPLVSYRV